LPGVVEPLELSEPLFEVSLPLEEPVPPGDGVEEPVPPGDGVEEPVDPPDDESVELPVDVPVEVPLSVEPVEPAEPALITSMRLTWSVSPEPEKLARTWSPSMMSVSDACCPSFMTRVSSSTFSFLSEFAIVSSFEVRSNFSTLPLSSFADALALVAGCSLDAVEEPVPL
jgi:hypothetical protein